VFGHRRTRAAKIAGEATVPAIVRELTDAQAAQLQAIENVQREDLDAIEEALGYQRYIKRTASRRTSWPRRSACRARTCMRA
jgi:ParB/RepB/Spo0J family partition protein